MHHGSPDRRIKLTEPRLGAAELREIEEAMREGWVTGGPRVARFTTALRSYLGVEHIQCLSSCTAALTLALIEAGVGPGDDVLLPSVTFVACANVIVHRGARPVLVDVDPRTGLIDLAAARAAITDRTRAVIVVHLHGRPCDMGEVAAFTAETGIPVVEDAAHAIGALWEGTQIGAFGNATAFSFHASKNVTTVDGGALVSTSAEAMERAAILSRQGMSRPSWERHEDSAPGIYDIVAPGFKFSMHDLAAAIGIHQLKQIEPWAERRLAIAARYDEVLADLDVDLFPSVPDHARHAMHVYAIRIRGGAARRNRVAHALNDLGIGTSVHFRALHQHTYYANACQVTPDSLPAATEFSDTQLSLPMHPALTDDDVDHVARGLRRALAG